MNLPAAHSVQTVEAGDALYAPASQTMHRAAPSLGWCSPGGHDVHAAGDACPSSALKRPAGHLPQLPPALGLYSPAGHGLQLRVVALNSAPAAHETHPLRSAEGTFSSSHRRHSPDAAPAWVAPVHAEQTVLPFGARVPAGHSTHVARSDEGTWPSSHSVQRCTPTAPAAALWLPSGHRKHARSSTCALAFASA